MIEVGYVKEIKGDRAFLEFKRKTSCGDNCGTCSSGCDNPPLTVDMLNTLYVEKGDEVEVEMDDMTFLKFSFWAYGIPLIMLVLGIVLGVYYFKSIGYANYELMGLICGFIFLAISYGIVSIINKKVKKKKIEAIKMIRIVEKNEYKF